MIPINFTGDFWAAENGMYAEVSLRLNGHHFAVIPVEFDTTDMGAQQVIEKCLRERLIKLFGATP